MPEEKQDPANTQMFRAFVERGQEPERTGMRPALLIAAAALVVVIVAIVAIAVS
jgi:hypothetical protein